MLPPILDEDSDAYIDATEAWGSSLWITVTGGAAPFFANPTTGSCAWQPPENALVLPASVAGEWWSLVDTQGIPYYYHTKTQKTTWNRPTAGLIIPMQNIVEWSAHLAQDPAQGSQPPTPRARSLNRTVRNSILGQPPAAPRLAESIPPRAQSPAPASESPSSASASSRSDARSSLTSGPSNGEPDTSEALAVLHKSDLDKPDHRRFGTFLAAHGSSTISLPEEFGAAFTPTEGRAATMSAKSVKDLGYGITNSTPSLEAYAAAHFTRPRFFRRQRSIRERITWQGDAIREPLHPLPTQLRADAVECFACLARAMSEAHEASVDELAKSWEQQGDILTASQRSDTLKIIETGVRSVELRDEIYAQLLKQLNHCPSTAAFRVGFQVLEVCSTWFAPQSLTLLAVLQQFLQSHDHGITVAAHTVSSLAHRAFVNLGLDE